MISISSKKIDEIFLKYHSQIDEMISTSLDNIKKFRATPDKFDGKSNPRKIIQLQSNEIIYLDYLISHFLDIMIADSDEIEMYKAKFDQIITGTDMFKNHKEFKNELLKRLGYENYRDKYYPEYFELTGIKACVYCNSQLAITVKSFKGTKSAKYQVDHNLAKSEYPCFSVSFFNLFPVCAVCNGKKSSKDLKFHLYSNKITELKNSLFSFKLSKVSVVKYRVNGNPELLDIKFIDNECKGFNEMFDIEGIYQKQKDLAEEIVLKSIIYNEKYLKGLRESFSKLYPNKIPMAERLLIGNYSNEKDIHKRPMAKFTMDIAKDLNLI